MHVLGLTKGPERAQTGLLKTGALQAFNELESLGLHKLEQIKAQVTTNC